MSAYSVVYAAKKLLAPSNVIPRLFENLTALRMVVLNGHLIVQGWSAKKKSDWGQKMRLLANGSTASHAETSKVVKPRLVSPATICF